MESYLFRNSELVSCLELFFSFRTMDKVDLNERTVGLEEVVSFLELYGQALQNHRAYSHVTLKQLFLYDPVS